MPSIPGDAIHVLGVFSFAVVNPVEIGICAAVVPISTFTELGTVIHTLVIVLVLRAEGRVVVVPQGIPSCVPGVIPHKQPVAIYFIAKGELLVLGIACVTFPVLQLYSQNSGAS